ncbi:unnamed protein product [Parascedosporium putredinis]|uniref:NAD-dependent epimerase/dehydratase domain-containing protein n=1 Tax=Parascedosporium putredinis TaxID=1442378 RepID=A0A9P1HE19_9PEZI|nr:unnamed protein product [Parascedosporium putredinis]CAI8004613.1 unnamed protein product [Parascedosporium putredinis]
MTSVLLFGSTGLTGSNILETLAKVDGFSKIWTISRRAPKTQSAKLEAIVEADTDTWTKPLADMKPETVISALGSTRASAGGIQNQWKIDHDANVAIAKEAKAQGVKTFVFVSSTGTRGFLSSMAPYSKMKIGVEDTVTGLGFDHAIILRPGGILGERENPHLGGPLMNAAIRSLSKISQGWQDSLGQEAEVIGRAAVHAAKLAAEGKAPKNPWILEQADIVRLGREEWKNVDPTA